MRILRWVAAVLVRIDPGLWYVIDLRRRAALSWVPVVLMMAPFTFGATQCFLARNNAGGMFLSALALTLAFIKLRASAHVQKQLVGYT
jgi:hypothetical protein